MCDRCDINEDAYHDALQEIARLEERLKAKEECLKTAEDQCAAAQRLAAHFEGRLIAAERVLAQVDL